MARQQDSPEPRPSRPLPEGLESPPNAESAEKQSQGLQQLQHEFILLPDDQQDGETDTPIGKQPR